MFSLSHSMQSLYLHYFDCQKKMVCKATRCLYNLSAFVFGHVLFCTVGLLSARSLPGTKGLNTRHKGLTMWPSSIGICSHFYMGLISHICDISIQYAK